MRVYVLVNKHSGGVGCYTTKALALKEAEDYFNKHINKTYFPDGWKEFFDHRCRIEEVTLITEDDE